MEIIQSKTAFLSSDLVEKCFKKGKVTHVDKQICGNGYSTAFLNLQPSANKINIIIAPNKAVIIEKQKQYLDGNFNTRIKFFFKEGTDTDFENADILFFIADSFLLMKDKLKEIAHLVDKVLIDEFHTIEIQSLFRYNLIDFQSKVQTICQNPNTAIVTVTASPNLYSNTDILIENSLIKESTIIVSKDRERALNRIKIDLKEGKNVVVFTNSNTVIYNLRNYKNELTAKFVIGTNLMRSLVELVKIIPNENSNLTIVSSKGFEGYDIYYSDAKVYFFEDRAKEHENFFISNLYQAINRTRKGASYIEYNRLEISNKRKNTFKNIDIDIDKFINDKSISVSAKQKKEYSKFHSFVVFNESDGIFTIKKNITAVKLYKETLLFDIAFPSDSFKDFLNIRKISIKHLSEVGTRITKKVKNTTKEKNLLSNAGLIKSLDLFGNDFKIEIKDFHSQKENSAIYDNVELYHSHLKAFLRRKYYNGNKSYSAREITALNLFSNAKEYQKNVKTFVKAYDIRSINKYGRDASAPYRKTFRNKSYNVFCKLVLMFANERIFAPSKWIAHRDYNILTEIGINEIDFVAKLFNIKITEIDIKNCFSRVLYSNVGIELPKDFYGENKKNKLTINIFLNDFFYNKNQKSDKKIQRNNAILKFRNLGFNEDVINFLMDKFFEVDFRGDLFNFLSYHERKIIKEVKTLAANWINEGVIRRHDSVIIFNNKTDLTVLNNYKYENVAGWFSIPEIKVITLEPEKKIDIEFEAFYKELQMDLKKNEMDAREYGHYLSEKFKRNAV